MQMQLPLPERAPRHSVASGLAGIVVLTSKAAHKLQCVRKLDGTWWSRGWSARDLADMVDATSEVSLMRWAAGAGISPALRAVHIVPANDVPSTLPRWLPTRVFAKECEAVLVTTTERVGPVRPNTVSLASVKRIVQACTDRRIVLDDTAPANFGQRGTKLLVIDWGRVLRVQSADLARRLTADGLLDMLSSAAQSAQSPAPPSVVTWLRAAAGRYVS